MAPNAKPFRDRVRAVDIAGREPPNNPEAERAVLSAVLYRGGAALDEVLEILSASAFYGDAHQRIFDAAVEIHNARSPVDLQTVGAYLRERGRLQAVGGYAYLAQIVDATPSVANVAAHAKVLRALYKMRRAIERCQIGAAEGHGDYGDADEFVAKLQDDIANIAEDRAASRLAFVDEIGRARAKEIREQWEGKREPWGLRGPHRELHEILWGYELAKTTYVVADTGGGKSAYAQQVGIHLAHSSYGRDEKGEPERVGVGYITLEMPREGIYDRGVVMTSHRLAPVGIGGVTLKEYKSGRKTGTQTEANPRGEPLDAQKIWLIEQSMKHFDALPFLIDDADKDIKKVRTTARTMQARMQRERGARLRFLVVDHMHIMEFPDADREDQALAKMVRGFNRIAVELGIHVMVLAQFNKEGPKRDGRPSRKDIRGSAAIAQIAHNILIIHRPHDGVAGATEEQKRAAEVIVDKNRDGQRCIVPMEFRGELYRFDEAN